MESELLCPEDRSDILAVGVYPPPVMGQSEAFRILVDGLGLPRYDLAELGHYDDGMSNAARAGKIARSWWRFFRRARGVKVAYFSVAQSKAGFLRDLGFILAARVRGCKTVAHLHGRLFESLLPQLPRWFRGVIERVYRRFDRVVLLSSEFRPMMEFVREEAIVFLPNGIPIGIEPPVRSIDAQLRILFLSNIFPSKGVAPLIQAMAQLPDRYSLILAGAPMVLPTDPYATAADFDAYLSSEISRLGLGDRIKKVGVVVGEQKEELLRSCHVLALPSTYPTEAQPICVIEGMMAGMPAVVTPTADLKNMVDQTCGVTVERPDPESLAQAIEEVTADAARYRQLASNARARAVSRYSESAHLQTAAAIFADLLKK